MAADQKGGAKRLPPCLSRRRFLRQSLTTAAAVALPVSAGAQWRKATKPEAGYFERDGPGAQTCTTCHLFFDSGECLVVEGPISPWGYCNFYED